MKFKNIMISSFMVLLLVFTFFLNVGLSVSGPKMKFDKENERLINKIKEKYPKADNFYRHSFQYVTYSANDGYYYRFFDKDGELIVSCLKSKADFAKVKAIAENEFNVEDPLIELGYGYNNPCYVIDQEDVILLIDFDTYEVVYYLKENLV